MESKLFGGATNAIRPVVNIMIKILAMIKDSKCWRRGNFGPMGWKPAWTTFFNKIDPARMSKASHDIVRPGYVSWLKMLNPSVISTTTVPQMTDDNKNASLHSKFCKKKTNSRRVNKTGRIATK